MDESSTKYQRIQRLFNFKGTGGKTVCSIAQFHHVKHIRDRLSVTAFRWRAGAELCEKKEVYVLYVLGNVAWEPHSEKTKHILILIGRKTAQETVGYVVFVQLSSTP
jgi:hypothetical protein